MKTNYNNNGKSDDQILWFWEDKITEYEIPCVTPDFTLDEKYIHRMKGAEELRKAEPDKNNKASHELVMKESMWRYLNGRNTRRDNYAKLIVRSYERLQNSLQPNNSEILAINRSYLLSMGTSILTINRLEEANYLSGELISSLDDSESYAIALKVEESKKRKKIKRALRKNSPNLQVCLKEYYHNMDRFVIKEVFEDLNRWESLKEFFGFEQPRRLKYKMLFMYDKDNKRIYHTVKFSTKIKLNKKR